MKTFSTRSTDRDQYPSDNREKNDKRNSFIHFFIVWTISQYSNTETIHILALLFGMNLFLAMVPAQTLHDKGKVVGGGGGQKLYRTP